MINNPTNNVITPIAGQEGATEVEPEVDEWANLAGDARRTGEEGGPAQCALAAARNASRDENLTREQFMQWCENSDMLTPYGALSCKTAARESAN